MSLEGKVKGEGKEEGKYEGFGVHERESKLLRVTN